MNGLNGINGINTSPWDDDAALLADLAAALHGIAPLREAVAERGRSAYTWRTVDDELALAVISFDSALDLEAPLRDGENNPQRVLIFDADGISVELEVSQDRIAGQIFPPSTGHVVIEMQRGPEGTITADADELGFFILPGGISGTVRLLCDTPGAKLITEWVSLQ
jgi:hypothetical protein